MTLAEQVRRRVWPRRGLRGRLGYLALRPLSTVFGVGVSLRNLGYRTGLLRVHQAALPVISVGNLAVGGTGKTPFTLWLSRTLAARGLRVAILLRGYGGSASGVAVVSRGEGPRAGPAEVGDEAVMLAKSFSGVVVAAARRADGAAAAVELGCEVAVLDDGFQHRAIGRVFDLVLVNGRRGPLLPAGPLRERPAALRRADAVILVDHHLGCAPPALPRAGAGKPAYRMHVEPAALVEAVAGRWLEHPLGRLAGKRVIAVAGIARPEGFYELLRQWDAVVDEVFEFPDHHRYRGADWQQIARRGRDADLIVTTEKDLVKLEAFPFATGKLVALRVVPRVERADELIGSILARTGLGGCADRPARPTWA